MSTIYKQRRSVAPLRFVTALLLSVGVLVASNSVATAAPVPAPTVKKLAAAPKVEKRWDARTDDVYNIPQGGKGSKAEQNRILDAYQRGLMAAPRGATVRVSTFSSGDLKTTGKVINADRRGVNVKYVTWKHTAYKDAKRPKKGYNKSITRLIKALKTNTQKPSYIKLCNGSCVLDGSKGTHHAKYMTIDRIIAENGRELRYISILGSANLSVSSATKSFNTAQVLVGNKVMFDALNQYITDMTKDRTKKSGKKRAIYPVVSSGGFTLWRSPKADSNPMYTELRNTKCTTRKGFGVAVQVTYKVRVKVKGKYKTVTKTRTEYRTDIKIGMFYWTQFEKRTAMRLRELKKQKCRIQIAVKANDTNKSVLNMLKKDKFPLWTVEKSNGYLHAKGMSISGRVGGKDVKERFDGSTNWTKSANKYNSDTILRQRGLNAAQSYGEWFDRMVNSKAAKRLS